MKKVLIIIGIIFGVLAVGAFTVFVLVYTGVISEKQLDDVKVYTNYNEDGLMYTESEWDWLPMNNKNIIQYEENVNIPTTTVALCIDSDTFYDVTIPDVPYFYDFGKTIWAGDGSFRIKVINDMETSDISAVAGIDNGTNVNRLTIVNDEKTKGRRVIATLVDDAAIIAEVFSTNEHYSVLRDSLASNHNSYKVDVSIYTQNCPRINKITYEGKYCPQVVYSNISLTSDRYLFADGYVWTQSIVEPYYVAKDKWLAKLITSSGGGIDEMYEDGNVMFARSGDYYAGAVKYNTNTSIVLIGKGEEAYCNIVSVIDLAK